MGYKAEGSLLRGAPLHGPHAGSLASHSRRGQCLTSSPWGIRTSPSQIMDKEQTYLSWGHKSKSNMGSLPSLRQCLSSCSSPGPPLCLRSVGSREQGAGQRCDHMGFVSDVKIQEKVVFSRSRVTQAQVPAHGLTQAAAERVALALPGWIGLFTVNHYHPPTNITKCST